MKSENTVRQNLEAAGFHSHQSHYTETFPPRPFLGNRNVIQRQVFKRNDGVTLGEESPSGLGYFRLLLVLMGIGVSPNNSVL